MINPKRYKWNDTAQNIIDAGVDLVKLEKVAELAALKIYPVYTAFNLEMGDRTPSLQYLTQIIFELTAGQIANPSDSYSWGGIVLESTQWGETEDDYFGINISYHLGSYDYTEVTK
jgi:hypothetical protein